jgi:hypothetical protein
MRTRIALSYTALGFPQALSPVLFQLTCEMDITILKFQKPEAQPVFKKFYSKKSLPISVRSIAGKPAPA